MNQKKFDFWRDHYPDGYGKRTGECGDTVEMFLCINNGRIQSVSFDTDGCINTNACANTVSHLSEGKTIEKAWEIAPNQKTGLHHSIAEGRD